MGKSIVFSNFVCIVIAVDTSNYGVVIVVKDIHKINCRSCVVVENASMCPVLAIRI